jgi:hypothetical protein
MDLSPKLITAFFVGLKSRIAAFALQRTINEYREIYAAGASYPCLLTLPSAQNINNIEYFGIRKIESPEIGGPGWGR